MMRVVQSKNKAKSHIVLTFLVVIGCNNGNHNAKKLNLFNNLNTINVNSEILTLNLDSNKPKTGIVNVADTIQIKQFLETVLDDSATNSFIYDKYFNQTSEIENIMKGAYFRSVLDAKFYFDTLNKKESLTLNYLLWRFKQNQIIKSNQVKKVETLIYYPTKFKVIRISFTNHVKYFFIINLDGDFGSHYISNIYDNERLTLIPDNDVWDKIDLDKLSSFENN